MTDYDPVANGIGCYNDWIEYRRAKLLRERRERRTTYILAGCVAIAAIVLSTSPLWAQMKHDRSNPAHWYDDECCNLKDCRPLAKEEMFIAADGSGWHVRMDGIDTIVPWGDPRIRIRKGGHDDLRHHGCSTQGDFNGPELLCIYPYQGGT